MPADAFDGVDQSAFESWSRGLARSVQPMSRSRKVPPERLTRSYGKTLVGNLPPICFWLPSIGFVAQIGTPCTFC